MKNPRAWFAGLLVAFLLTGCARYDITPIPASEVSCWGRSAKSGYIIYQPELYFAVNIKAGAKDATDTKKDKDGERSKTTRETNAEVSVTPVYLPNYRKPYRVTTCTFLAKADFSFTFDDGWKLSKLEDKSDSSGVVSALAGQLKDILVTALARGTNQPAASSVDRQVILYRPEYDSGGVVTNFIPVSAPAH
jgi:hypothetical protein